MKNGEHLLSTEKVGKAFWKLAIPALITTLISQIYNLTDTYFIGMLNDTAMLSAVSIAMPFMWLVNAFCGMVGAGAPKGVPRPVVKSTIWAPAAVSAVADTRSLPGP